jgi:hypothetical protein
LSLICRSHRDTLGFAFSPVLDDPAFYSLLFGVLLNPEQNGFSLSSAPRRIRHLQKQCGTLIKLLWTVEAAANAKRKTIMLKCVAAMLREPQLDSVQQFKVQAMSNNSKCCPFCQCSLYSLSDCAVVLLQSVSLRCCVTPIMSCSPLVCCLKR